MSIHENMRVQIAEAMKAKDTVRLNTLRGLLTMFTNEAVATGRTPQDLLTDDEAISVVKRAVKQRKEAIDQFIKGGRKDLADVEETELALLTPLLPATMSDDEIKKIAETKKIELGIEDRAKIGILIGAVMKETGGKADGGDVKRIVEELF